MGLPDPVVSAIVRGVAAYMQIARPTDLPVPLRPLHGKHSKMLTPRKSDIVAALDDDGLRALLLDWLDDKPSGISKPDAAILTVAARREDGWESELARQTPARPDKLAGSVDPNEAIGREKQRSRKAKEEARAAKDAAARQIAAERKEAASLRSQIEQLTQQLAGLEKELAAAERAKEAAVSEMDREVRKARKRAEKAEAGLDEVKANARALRAEMTQMKVASQPVKKKPEPARAPVVSEPSRRRRLAVPKGRFEDDPATLTEWLSTPYMHLLVDGYNVSKAKGGFGDLRLESQRDRLLQEVGKVARRHKIKATVIFDGSDIGPGTSRRARGPVEVEYSRPGEIADDHLIAKLEGLPRYPVVVATNDRELQNRAARLGATIATSNQLLGLIR